MDRVFLDGNNSTQKQKLSDAQPAQVGLPYGPQWALHPARTFTMGFPVFSGSWLSCKLREPLETVQCNSAAVGSERQWNKKEGEVVG